VVNALTVFCSDLPELRCGWQGPLYAREDHLRVCMQKSNPRADAKLEEEFVELDGLTVDSLCQLSLKRIMRLIHKHQVVYDNCVEKRELAESLYTHLKKKRLTHKDSVHYVDMNLHDSSPRREDSKLSNDSSGVRDSSNGGTVHSARSQEFQRMTVKHLLAYLKTHQIPHGGCLEKSDLIQLILSRPTSSIPFSIPSSASSASSVSSSSSASSSRAGVSTTYFFSSSSTSFESTSASFPQPTSQSAPRSQQTQNQQQPSRQQQTFEEQRQQHSHNGSQQNQYAYSYQSSASTSAPPTNEGYSYTASANSNICCSLF